MLWKWDPVNVRGTCEYQSGSDTSGIGFYNVQPSYNVTIEAVCDTDGIRLPVSITMDGNPTGYNTPHTFTGLTGTHTFTVPSTDSRGHPFRQWSTGSTSTTITVTSGGTYTAHYGAAPGVGGIVIPIDNMGLLAPYVGLGSTILVATFATAIYVKRVKRRREKQYEHG